MAIKRVVDIGFWTDSKILYFTPEDKYFFLYLLTNPHTTQLGIYEINTRQCAFEMGYSEETIENLFVRFETKYKIIKRIGEEIAIKNFLRYAIVKGGKPVEDCLNKEIKKVKNKKLLSYIKSAIDGREDLNETVKKVFLPIVLNDNGNDNDNDNEDTSTYRPRIVENGSSSTSQKLSIELKKKINKEKSPSPEKKTSFAEFVTLTQPEYDMLTDKLGNEQAVKDCIEILDNYKGASGKKYKSDYRAIRSWVIDKYKEKHKEGGQRGQLTSNNGQNVFKDEDLPNQIIL